MARLFPKLVVLTLAAALCLIGGLSWRSLRRVRSQGPEEDRVTPARARVIPGLRESCRAAALPYPPAELYLRAFKNEAELEVWARAGEQPFRLLLTLPITALSGEPGPKRKEGDRQVPEGFYVLDLFNPKSNFHLSMRVNYPNQSDRILSDPVAPGSDIYVHGKNCSIGCLALGDENIERIYVLATDVSGGGQRPVPIHIFPARMSGEAWPAFFQSHASGNAKLAEFWKSLQPAYDAFEKNHLVPDVSVATDGGYRLEK